MLAMLFGLALPLLGIARVFTTSSKAITADFEASLVSLFAWVLLLGNDFTTGY
jgi:hypothetical protein